MQRRPASIRKESEMLFAKIVSTIWALLAFWFCVYLLIHGVNAGRFDFVSGLMKVITFWVLIGFAPIAVAKFAWEFIR